MITADDTNVLLDLLGTSSQAESQADAIVTAARQGTIVVSAVVYAEVAGRFTGKTVVDTFFRLWGCKVEPLDTPIAYLAAVYFREYRQRGGDRLRILPDFLIAAHAELNADRILTRDKRFFGTTFPRLTAVSPEELSTPPS